LTRREGERERRETERAIWSVSEFWTSGTKEPDRMDVLTD